MVFSSALRAFLVSLKEVWKLASNQIKDLEPLIRDHYSQAYASDKNLIDKLLLYVLGNSDFQKEEVKKLIHQHMSEQAGVSIMTTLERIRTEGIEIGIETGIERGSTETNLRNARTMLRKGYPLTDIIEITGLTEEQLKDAGINGKTAT